MCLERRKPGQVALEEAGEVGRKPITGGLQCVRKLDFTLRRVEKPLEGFKQEGT